MRKADYKKIAETYDIARLLSDQNLDKWLELIAKKVGHRQQIKFLDLGCGTGRFAIPIAKKLGYSVIGVDSSKEMIEKAKEKDTNNQVVWDIQDAVNLNYAACSFDVIFMSHLLHHIDNPDNVVKQCFRLLKGGGVIINRYGALEHICDDPEHTFFVEALKIDKVRTPSINMMETWFIQAGFSDVSSETILQQTYVSAAERLERVKMKSTSVLNLISQQALEEGIRNLQKYISEHPEDHWLLMDKITLTAGRKI